LSRGFRFYRRCSAAELLRSSCPQQRQLSELLALLWLCRLLSDAFALLREPVEHACDVHRTLLRTLWRIRHRVLPWLYKGIISCLHGWFIPTVLAAAHKRP